MSNNPFSSQGTVFGLSVIIHIWGFYLGFKGVLFFVPQYYILLQ